MDQNTILPYPIIRKILSELDFVTFLEDPTTIYLMMTYKTEKKLEWKYFIERAKSSLTWYRRIRNKEYYEIYDLDPIQVIFSLVHRRVKNENICFVLDRDGRSKTKFTNIDLVGSEVSIYDSREDFWEIAEGDLKKRCFAFCMLIKTLKELSVAWDDVFSE
jgi:hypothetical protein